MSALFLILEGIRCWPDPEILPDVDGLLGSIGEAAKGNCLNGLKEDVRADKVLDLIAAAFC